MCHRWTFGVLACVCLAASTASARVYLTLSPYAGAASWSSDLDVRSGLLTGARAGVMLGPWVGVEGTYGLSPTGSASTVGTATTLEHLGVDVVLPLLRDRRIIPYAAGGWSQITYDVGVDGPDVFDGWEFGGGIRTRITERETMDADLRLDARNVVTSLSSGFANAQEDHHHLLFTLGVQFSIGRPTRDEDGDGVWDRADACPGTPIGAEVDPAGCALDTDADGVADGLDLCADTPLGALVNGGGCPMDADGDGVYDGLDRCADSPMGALVDGVGCTLDSDRDGIVDGLDRCLDTPWGASVDEAGCPLDADYDGVADGIDVCPRTPRGLAVNPDGCPIEVAATTLEFLDTGRVSSSRIRFESGSATLRMELYSVLEEIGRVLVEWPELRIEVAGHTDHIGTDAYNDSLSRDRARSVLGYLTQRFPRIRVGQFTTVGYGERQPVADNVTDEGRARNRRVEFVVLNRDRLHREIETRQALRR